MLTVLEKVFSILIMIGIGFACYRSGKLSQQAKTDLTFILLSITTPCINLYTIYERELNSETIAIAGQSFFGALGYVIIAGICASVFTRIIKARPEDRGCFILMMISLNNGFMGFPVTKEIFGSDVLYALVFHNICMTMYYYSVGILQLSSSTRLNLKETVKALANPIMGAIILGIIILITGIKVPRPIDDLVRTIGDLTVPISMIVVGLQLGPSKVKSIVKNKKLLFAALFSMLFIPLLTFLVTNWLPLYTEVKIVIIFSSVFPGAVVPVALAEKYGKNAQLIAESVTITTLISLVTIPIAASLLSYYYL